MADAVEVFMFSTFLNYVTDVYMYLKVTGGIFYRQRHPAFHHLAPEEARWSIGPFPLRARERVNPTGTMVSPSVRTAVQLKLVLSESARVLLSPLIFIVFHPFASWCSKC